MTDSPTPRPARRPLLWLSVAGVTVGLVIVGVRVVTLPEDRVATLVLGAIGAVAVTAAIVAAGRSGTRARLRAALSAYPDAVVIPIVVGAATAVATRWLAERFGDPRLETRMGSRAVVAVDAAGVHVVTDPRAPHGHLPASAVTLGPLGRTIIGVREVDALVLDVEAGDATAPLSLVPARVRGNPLATLTDAELLDVTARIEAALTGRPVRPGWEF